MPGLPPDVTFCLDSAMDCGDITGDVYTFLSVFHPDPVAWHDSIGEQGDYFAVLRASSRQALAAWRAKASAEDRAALSWAGIGGLAHALTDSARHVLSEAIRTTVSGGRVDREAAARLALDPGFVALHAKPFLPALSEIALRAGEDIRVMGPAAFASARARLDEIHRIERERRLAMIGDSAAAREPLPVRDSRRIRKARRKPLRRSVEFLSSILGRRQASAFVSGDAVTVKGRRFDFRVRKGVLTSNGHGAMDITVTDKNSVELVDLCFYFQDMPAPDQLAGLVLHVQAGEEDEIIKTANVIRSHAGAAGNPDLALVRGPRYAPSRLSGQAERAEDDVQDDPFGMARHIDMTLYGGVSGSSRTYNDLHDVIVPAAMRVAAEVAAQTPEGRMLFAAAPALSTDVEAACISMAGRVTDFGNPETGVLGLDWIDGIVEALPESEKDTVWRETVGQYEFEPQATVP